MRRRVAITGLGAVSPYGYGVDALMDGLTEGKPALSHIPEELKIKNVDCHVAGLVPPSEISIPREIRRGMSPMSIYAYRAAREALSNAGLVDEKHIGVCVGSTLGSGMAIASIFEDLHKKGHLDHVRSMEFFKIMGHSVASNLALALALEGRTISPTAACSTGLQAIGIAYETIAHGMEECMLCGGAEEFSFLATATFDKIGAASHAQDPYEASRPFDRRREGIVCSEGAGILCLEELNHARERNAPILGEIVGFSTSAFPGMALLELAGAKKSMLFALKDANLDPESIGYINAHATATVAGDMAEGLAIEEIFGDRVPVGSLKAHIGHSLAASGALETIASLRMLINGSLIGMIENHDADPACGRLRFAKSDEILTKKPILKNSFALGGVYSSLVISHYYPDKDQ